MQLPGGIHPRVALRIGSGRHHILCQLPSYLALWHAQQFADVADWVGLRDIQ